MLSMFMVLLLMGSDTPAQEELGKNWQIARLDWKGDVTPGTIVEVNNLYGDIRARGASSQTVEVIANVQKGTEDKNLIFFRTKEEKGRLIIDVVYEGDDADTYKKNGKRRLDMTVFVPDNAILKAQTHKGLLEAKVGCSVDLTSDRGKIFIRTNGHAVAKNRQGNTRAVLKKIDWDKPAVFESQIGDIEVEIVNTASVSFHAETTGHIASDYSTEIKRDTKTWMKTARVKVGEGKHKINIINKTGNITMIEGRWKLGDK